MSAEEDRAMLDVVEMLTNERDWHSARLAAKIALEENRAVRWSRRKSPTQHDGFEVAPDGKGGVLFKYYEDGEGLWSPEFVPPEYRK